MIRLTSGIFKGRTLKSPAGASTRPTHAKLRQALFNSIQTEIPQARVLDLFAGSGALGFEALSRGATHVVFVESHSAAVQAIRSNVQTLKIESQVQLISKAIPTPWLTDPQPRHFFSPVEHRVAENGPFDIIFADPPYSEGWEMKLLSELPWDRWLRSGGLFCLEWGVQKSVVSVLPDTICGLTKTREKDYGDSRLTHYVKD